MDITSTNKKRSFKEGLLRRLHNPMQLRAAICVGLLAGWYWIGYAPMSGRIDVTTASLQRDRKRLVLANEIESLREESERFADRLPPRSDPNEFVQYIVEGVRAGPLKLVSLNPEVPKDAGPYEVAMVKIELEGKYQDLDAFFRWVENDKRLLRIDNLIANPDSRDPDLLKVQLNVLGLMGVEEKPKTDEKPKPEAKPGPSNPKGKAKTKESAPKPKEPTKPSIRLSDHREPSIANPGENSARTLP